MGEFYFVVKIDLKMYCVVIGKCEMFVCLLFKVSCFNW